MYVNCTDTLIVDDKKVETVKEFKYLGLRLSSSSKKPEILL
jgi:hypothetical protein